MAAPETIAAGSGSETTRDDIGRLRATCLPCDLFTREKIECRAVAFAGSLFVKVFDDRRCRPHEFLVGFLRRHLGRRYGSQHADRAEDIASRIVVEILENPPSGPFVSNDLTGLRRFLAAVGVRRAVDDVRGDIGRVRCGNCLHHHESGPGRRVCRHPDPDHPWSDREVRASEDPRGFEPPCHDFTSRRRTESADTLTDGAIGTDPGASPEAPVFRSEGTKVFVDAFAAVHRRDPKVALALHMDFFENKVNSEIARTLRTTVRTVTRYKQKGLAMLQSELQNRGIEHIADLHLGAA